MLRTRVQFPPPTRNTSRVVHDNSGFLFPFKDLSLKFVHGRPPPPTSIPMGHRPPEIYLQTFAPAAFSQPLHLRQPQYRWGTALPKFACRHLHLRHFLCRSTSANLNTDRAPPSQNLLADICTCGVFPAASPQPTSIPAGYRHPQICLQTFACGHR